MQPCVTGCSYAWAMNARRTLRTAVPVALVATSVLFFSGCASTEQPATSAESGTTSPATVVTQTPSEAAPSPSASPQPYLEDGQVLEDAAGYKWFVGARVEGDFAFSQDITQAPPGMTDGTLNIFLSGVVSNMNPGRENPGAMDWGYNVFALFDNSSKICSVSDRKWIVGGYCALEIGGLTPEGSGQGALEPDGTAAMAPSTRGRLSDDPSVAGGPLVERLTEEEAKVWDETFNKQNVRPKLMIVLKDAMEGAFPVTSRSSLVEPCEVRPDGGRVILNPMPCESLALVADG